MRLFSSVWLSGRYFLELGISENFEQFEITRKFHKNLRLKDGV